MTAPAQWFKVLPLRLALSLAFTGCGSAQFSADTLKSGHLADASSAQADAPANSGTDSTGTGGASGAADQTRNDTLDSAGTASATGSSTATATATDPGAIAPPGATPCPKVTQTVLVLDFKSGWWAGDGGDFFQTLLGGLTSPCIAQIKIEYHHVTEDGNTTLTFPAAANAEATTVDLSTADNIASSADLSAYTQIWVLSGSVGDDLDLRTDDPIFTGLLAKIKASKAALFVASGNGNITHVNALLGVLGAGSKFATHLPEGPVVDATGAFTVLTRLTLGVGLTAGPLFGRGVNSIADAMQTAQSDIFLNSTIAMHSDYIVPDATLTPAAKNPAGEAEIAATAATAARKMVLDGGLQRFYVIRGAPTDDTKTYLQNVLLFLSGN